MDMTPPRWDAICRYSQSLCHDPDEQLRTLMDRAAAAGLPRIAVSSDVGHLLFILARLVSAGRPRPRALELGTLAGYSGIWIARGLGERGELTTLEPEPRHADFAQREFESAGLTGRVRIVRQPALEALPRLAGEIGAASLDLAFVDALKSEYPAYVTALKPLIRPGGLLVLDNALGSGAWCMGDPPESTAPDQRASRDGADRANRMLAADPDFVTTIVANREGLLIAAKR